MLIGLIYLSKNQLQILIIFMAFHQMITNLFLLFFVMMQKARLSTLLLTIMACIQICSFPFGLKQTLSCQNGLQNYSVSINPNGSIIVGMSQSLNGCVFRFNSDKPKIPQVFTTTHPTCNTKYITNGQVIFTHGRMRISILIWDQQLSQYRFMIQMNSAAEPRGMISDDGRFFAFSGISGTTYVYEIDYLKRYIQLQTITLGSALLQSIDFSPNNQFLVMTDNSNMYVYTYNGVSFVPNQTINFARITYAKFANINNYLVVTLSNNFTNFYYFNSATYQFTLITTYAQQRVIKQFPVFIKSNILIRPKNQDFVQLMTYGYVAGVFTLTSQQIIKDKFKATSASMTPDNHYLLIGFKGYMKLFQDCNWGSRGGVVSLITGECYYCSLGCITCVADVGCSACNTALGYVLQTNNTCIIPTTTPIIPSITTDIYCNIPACKSCLNTTHCNICQSSMPNVQIHNGICCQMNNACNSLFWIIIFVTVLGTILVLLSIFGIYKIKTNMNKKIAEQKNDQQVQIKNKQSTLKTFTNDKQFFQITESKNQSLVKLDISNKIIAQQIQNNSETAQKQSQIQKNSQQLLNEQQKIKRKKKQNVDIQNPINYILEQIEIQP